MYRVLVGNIALQRGEPAIASRAYLEAARAAQDPALARRATEVALFARQRTMALEAAQLWQKLEPDADRPRQLVSSLQESGAGSDMKGELERLLAEAASNGATLGDAFMQLNRALSSQEALRLAYIDSSSSWPSPIRTLQKRSLPLPSRDTTRG